MHPRVPDAVRERVKAADVIAALRRRHDRPQWILLEEAWGIDALAWSLIGRYTRVAYEVKVSREDYRAELEAWPRKAELALQMSHAYYFATPAGLLHRAERRVLPAEAGLIEIAPDGRCLVERPAPWRCIARTMTPYDIATLIRYVRHEATR